MNRELLKTLLRSIRQSLGRFASILGIIALGVGFFAGLKCSYPAMLSTAGEYLNRQHFHDFQLLSSLGFTASDVEAFSALDGVAAAEGGRFADVYVERGSSRTACRVMSLTERVDIPELIAGRMPRGTDECLADSHFWDEKDLGTTLTLLEDNGEDTPALLSRRSFRIVGLARSPRYLSADRGDTTLGSGRLDSFLFVLPEAFDSDVWHEILLWCDLPGELYSDRYDDAHERMTDRVKTLENSLGAARQRELRADADATLADARRELDDGWREYREEKKKTEEELADALRQLEDGEAEIARGRKELDDGSAALAAGMAQIASARAEIEENRALLEEKRAELEEGRWQLEAGEAELAFSEMTYTAYKTMSLNGSAERVRILQGEIEILKNTLSAAEALPGAPGADQLRSRLAQKQDELAAALAEGPGNAGEFSGREDELAEGRERLAAARAELESGERALEEAEAQLEEAEEELNAAEAAYPQHLRELEEGREKLEQAAVELEEGRAAYENGLREAEDGFREAEEKLRDGEEALLEAEREAEDKLKLELYALNRGSNPGYLTFDNDIHIIDALSDVFPLFFALVAALVCITTMTRMVGEERTIIGTLKALGFSPLAVMSKYLLYAASAALLGCVLGFFLGTLLIPYFVWFAYGILYDYARLRFYFSPLMAALCLLVTVPGALGVTWAVCRQESRACPAELIRPKAPKKGKKILLERIAPLWRRLPFLTKLSLRNAFRFPLRVAMLLLGIGGCTALLVAGLGARDSIAHISGYQYEEILLYDLEVNLDTDERSASEISALWADEAEKAALTRQEPVTIRSGETEKSTRLIAARLGELEGLISLHDKGGTIAYPGPGEAVVTRKIAETTGLKTGDRFTLTTEEGESLSLTVTGVCENYIRHYVFTDLGSFARSGENTALLRLGPEKDAAAFGAALRAQKGVSYVTLARQERETMENSMRSMDVLIALIVVCSGALAFITLYNLTNINLMERTREIATVKVLGFTRRETAAYVLKENVLLSLLGAALGLVLGKGLHAVIINALVVEYMSFERRISLVSYALAFVITILFTLLTNAFMHRRLDAVNMAESLKSVE